MKNKIITIASHNGNMINLKWKNNYTQLGPGGVKQCDVVNESAYVHMFSSTLLVCVFCLVHLMYLYLKQLSICIVSHFIFWGSKITTDGDCSCEIKRCLLLGRKVMTNLDSILESRDITLPTKVRLVKAMVFPVVMYGCESWTVKKLEHWKIDTFELWCWRTLKSPLDCK